MSSTADSLNDEKGPAAVHSDQDPDAEFGGTEERKALEKKLLWKVDLRMSILIVIYILNYVSRPTSYLH